MKKDQSSDIEGMSKGAPSEIFAKARDLRKRLTVAETALWEKLKNNQVDGLKFRRQHPIGIYITDFYCHRYKLVIEVDGEYHLPNEQKEKDIERTRYLVENSLQVIRFTNEEVKQTIDKVIAEIRIVISKIDSEKD